MDGLPLDVSDVIDCGIHDAGQMQAGEFGRGLTKQREEGQFKLVDHSLFPHRINEYFLGDLGYIGNAHMVTGFKVTDAAGQQVVTVKGRDMTLHSYWNYIVQRIRCRIEIVFGQLKSKYDVLCFCDRGKEWASAAVKGIFGWEHFYGREVAPTPKFDIMTPVTKANWDYDDSMPGDCSCCNQPEPHMIQRALNHRTLIIERLLRNHFRLQAAKLPAKSGAALSATKETQMSESLKRRDIVQEQVEARALVELKIKRDFTFDMHGDKVLTYNILPRVTADSRTKSKRGRKRKTSATTRKAKKAGNCRPDGNERFNSQIR